MTNEHENMDDSASDVSGAEADGANGAGMSGLTSALSGGDAEFFVEEQKKPMSRGTLAVFGLIVAAVGGLYFMHARTGGPSSAEASAETVAANETINQFLSSGDQNIARMQAMIRDTEKIVAQFLRYPSMKQVPVDDLKTNPFRHASNAATPSADASEAELKRRKEQERLAVIKAVNELQLQSIMHSDKSRACMISNTLYQEGQQVESFTIETINPHSVIVRSGEFRFELKMQR